MQRVWYIWEGVFFFSIRRTVPQWTIPGKCKLLGNSEDKFSDPNHIDFSIDRETCFTTGEKSENLECGWGNAVKEQ